MLRDLVSPRQGSLSGRSLGPRLSSPTAAAQLGGAAARGSVSGLALCQAQVLWTCTLTWELLGLLGRGLCVWFQICEPHPGCGVWLDVDRAGRVCSLERPTLTRNPAEPHPQLTPQLSSVSLPFLVTPQASPSGLRAPHVPAAARLGVQRSFSSSRLCGHSKVA